MLLLLTAWGGSVAAAPAASPRLSAVASASHSASLSPTPTLPTCDFKIEDIVRRAGVGSVVPKRGRGIVGSFFGVHQSGSIQVFTSLDGIVTIKSKVTGQPEKIEVCKLS